MLTRLLLLSLLATPAWAGPAEDAAVAAQEVSDEQCAQAWSGKAVQKSSALVQVSTVLGQVSEAYDSTGASYLLYWRGVIFQCLGQYEAALDDLEAFVDDEGESAAYADQVRQAKLHLQRAGRKLGEVGAGAAASWIRAEDAFELRVGYGAGASVRARACTDEAPGAIHASNCTPSASPAEVVGVTAAPVDLAVRAAGFFVPAFGLGGGVELRYALDHVLTDSAGRDLSLDLAAPSPSMLGTVGPVLRLMSPNGRAAALRLRPQFAVGLDVFEPRAGHYNYEDDPTTGQLQGGTWLAARLGLQVAVDAQVEVANHAVLSFGGRIAAFAPAAGGLLIAQEAPEGAVQTPLDPIDSNRLFAGGWFGALFVPSEAGAVAVGPFVRADFDGRWMTFDETLPAVWDDEWKVYSTRRLEGTVVGGITVEFGAG